MCVSQAENLLYEKSIHLQESYHQICQHHQLRLHFLFLLYDSNQLRSHMQSMITYLDFPDWVCLPHELVFQYHQLILHHLFYHFPLYDCKIVIYTIHNAHTIFQWINVFHIKFVCITI